MTSNKALLADHKIETVIFIISFVLLSFLLSGCSSDDDSSDHYSCTDAGMGCSGNSVCIDGSCVCPKGFIQCLDGCIPFDDCCQDADCDFGESCIDGGCIDLCENISCPDSMRCVSGECRCQDSFKPCEEGCIPDDGCCSDADCAGEKICHEHVCSDKCDIISCRENEFCINGTCNCKDLFFRTSSGICLPKGMCETEKDCADHETCIAGFCTRDCYSYSEPIEISECFMDQAKLSKDVSYCDLVKEDKRNVCIYDVAIMNLDRSQCLLLPAKPPLDTFNYNQQQCVIEIAKLSQDEELCKKTPPATVLDPPDLDGYCRSQVKDYIESLNIKDIDECGDDCGCRYRFALRNDASYCSKVCAANKSSCLNEFY